MGDWFRARVRDHKANAELKRAIEALSEHRRFDELGPEQQEQWQRALRVARWLKASLGRTNPQLLTTKVLESIASKAHQLADQAVARNYNEMLPHADALLDEASKLPKLGGRAAAAADAEAFGAELAKAKTNGEMAQAIISELDTRVSALDSKLAEQSELLEAQRTRVEGFLNDQQKRYIEWNADRSAEQAKLLADFHASFAGAQRERDDSEREHRRQQTERFDALAQGLDGKASTTLKTLSDHEARAREIVGIIGNIGVTGDYQNVARREWWAAEILRFVGIVFFVLAVVAVGWVVYHVSSDGFVWQLAAFRLSIALLLLAPAVYCTRESSMHRAAEARNRRIALELAALKPFLEPLTQEDSRAIIKSKADEYFGIQTQKSLEDHYVKVGWGKIQVKDLIAIMERINELAKTAKS